MMAATARALDASRLLDAYGLMALALARKLTDLGHAQAVEDQMVALIDPIYDTTTNSTTAWRLVDFCDEMRRITGLPVPPKDPEAEAPGQV